MRRITIIIMGITLISKITGLVRDIVLSYFYGTSNISDAYLISLSVPMILFATISTAIATNFIPVYSKIEDKYGQKTGDKFTSHLINWIVLIGIVFVLLGNIFSDNITSLFAPGFDDSTMELASSFLDITFVTLIFIGITNILSSYLQYKNAFLVTSLSILPMNFIFIFSIYLSNSSNLLYLPYGILLAYLTQSIILIVYMKKFKFSYYFLLSTTDSDLRRMLFLSVPLIFGISVNQINTIIDRALASNVVEGGISALNYADRINVLLQGVVIASIITVYYPELVRLIQRGSYTQISNILKKTIFNMNVLLIPAMFITLFFSKEIVEFLFGRGEFNENSIILTSSSLFFYIIGIVFFGMREVIVRYFYAIENTRIPMKNAVIGMGTNIVLNLILVRIMGLSGLALATSLSSLIIFLLLIIDLKKEVSIILSKKEITSYFKIILASIFVSIFGKIIFNSLLYFMSFEISLVIAFMLCLLVYTIFLIIMKIETVYDWYIKIFKT